MKYILLIFGLTAAFAIQAQSIERQVIGSAGGSFSGSFQVDWTAGETVVSTVTAGSVMLTQGFHQPPEAPNAVRMVQAPVNLTAFPVPTSDMLNLNWVGEKSEMNLELYNAAGNLVYNGVWGLAPNFQLDLGNYSQGIYMLRISNTKETYTIQVSKI